MLNLMDDPSANACNESELVLPQLRSLTFSPYNLTDLLSKQRALSSICMHDRALYIYMWHCWKFV